jgi:hypothetical protein
MSFVWVVFQDLFWQPVITPAVYVFCITGILLLVEFLILSYLHHILHGPDSVSAHVLLMRHVSADISPLWSVILSMTHYHKIILVYQMSQCCNVLLFET